MQINVYGTVLFCIYLLLLVFLSVKGTKKTTDIESFSIAKGDINPIAAGITFAAAFSSAGTFLGLPGMAYKIGFATLWFPLMQWFPAMIGLTIISKRYRKASKNLSTLSVVDWVGDRYKSEFLRNFIGATTLLNIIYVAAQFVGVGIVFKTLLGVPYSTGVALGVGIVVAYVSFGGSYAHIYTNTLQGALMLVVGMICFISGFFIIPDTINTITSTMGSYDPNLIGIINPNSAPFATALAIAGIGVIHVYWSISPHLINKIQYLKDDRDIKKFVIVAAICIFLFGIVTFAGFYANTLFPDMPSPDDANPYYINNVFPKAIGGFFLVVILAAAMSTTDGILVYLGTLIGNTFYKNGYVKYREKQGVEFDPVKVDARALSLSRWAVVLVGVVSLPLAWVQPPFLVTLIWVSSCGVLSAITGPVLIGLYSRRASTGGALIGALGGFVFYLVIWFGKMIPSVYLAGAMGGTASIVLTYVGSLLTKPMSKEFVDSIFGDEKAS